LIGSSRPENTFATSAQPATATSSSDAAELAKAQVHYVFEPTPLPGQTSRHRGVSVDTSWELSKYPTALKLMLERYENRNNSISELSTRNEEGFSVAVGATRPQSPLVEWILIVEETHTEAFGSVARLRKIILACVFGTAGLIILMVPILTHWAVAPIRRLRAAALKSVIPEIAAQPSFRHAERRDSHTTDDVGGIAETVGDRITEKGRPAMWAKRLRAPLERLNSSANIRDQSSPRLFQIPGRVKERNHCVTDELTELTKTFNEMSDELMIQYTRLEERVAERTRELEKAKLAAETANESKTLFIANISHELKTPLNGILGMCAVCMGEGDLSRIKKSLRVVYQSGDLLLNLLNDLLTFSKNQIEQAIQLEEKEFKISDIRSQLAIIFQNQVHEKQIEFSVKCISLESSQSGRATLCLEEGVERTFSASYLEAGNLANMVLWGDQHRILQVLINLVSNSLKFTPENGKVQVRIRCVEDDSGSTAHITGRRASLFQVPNQPSTQSSIETAAEPRQSLSDARQPATGDMPSLMFFFEVEDNGPGIPAHLHRRIFDPFVQGDLGLNRKYGGTGLGLSICAQLSRIMGGAIVLDSEEGRGSIFTLRVPLKFVKEAAPSMHISSSPGSRTPSVLSLEDLSHAARTPSNHGSLRSEPVAPGFEKSDIQPRLVGLSQPFFTPTIPSSPSSSPSSHLTPTNGQPEGDSPKKIRVLVAEDNTVNQEVVRRYD
jgi:osomolarity two-component system sensor histidine kinase SLN1